MAAHTEIIKLKAKQREFYDITHKVQAIVDNSKVHTGICNVFCMGSTGVVMLNENDPMLMEDLKKSLNIIAKPSKLYHHPDNAHSHIQAAVISPGETVPVENGELILGTWQNVLFSSLDTRDRERKIVVTVIGD